MKTFQHNLPGSRWIRTRAFTLVEMMISVGVFLVLFMGAMLAIQIFALRVCSLAEAKLTSTADARKALNAIRDDIREAKTLRVGNCTTNGAASFSTLSPTNAAEGNALQIFPTTNSLPYTIYYLDTSQASNCRLMQYTVAGNLGTARPKTLASYLTNTNIFRAEDFQGNLLTNNLNNQVYDVSLQFYQFEYAARPGSQAAVNANHFQLRTKVCRRALN